MTTRFLLAPCPPRLRQGLLALMLVAGLAWAPSARAIPLPEYRAVVAAALAAAERAVEAPEPERAALLAAIDHDLARVGQIEDVAGRAVAIGNPPLRAALAAGDAAAVLAHLRALLAALDDAAARPPPPADAQARLAAVLARPEFQPPPPPWWERFLGPLLRPLEEAGERLLRTLLARRSGEVGAEWRALFLVLGVGAALGFGAVLAGAFAGNVVRNARLAPERHAPGQHAPATRARALQLAAAGEYRAAVRELYLATLHHLDARGVLRFRPTLTNREHLAAAGALEPPVAAALAALVETYDQLWYSGAQCGPDDWGRFVALCDAAWRLPGRLAATGEAAA